jgi:hypothetical protein
MCKYTIGLVLVVLVLGPESLRALGEQPAPPMSYEHKSKIYEESCQKIKLLTANLFQEHFVDHCLKDLPGDLRLKYSGYLTRYTSPGSKLDGEAENSSIMWTVYTDKGPTTCFNFWLSTRPTDETVQHVKIKSDDLYVNVDFVDENRGVDAKLPQLGNRSVRELLKQLEGEPEKKSNSKRSDVRSNGSGKQ